MLKAGEKAPDLRLKNQRGEEVALSSLWKEKPLVLAFFPGAFTPVCTKQLCGYQKELVSTHSLPARLIGISPDTPQKLAEFQKAYSLDFDFLSDPDKKAFKAYGSLFLMAMAGRSVFVISKDGKILHSAKEMIPITHVNAQELGKMLEGL